MPIFRVTSRPKLACTLSRFPSDLGTGREFKVIKAVNTTTNPSVGSFMSQRQVDNMIDNGVDVTIVLKARR